MCGIQYSHFIAAKFAGCKGSACSGRVFCHQTSQIYSLLWWRDLSCTFSCLKMEGLYCECREYLLAQPLPIWYSLDSTTSKSVVVFSFHSSFKILQWTRSRWEIRLAGPIQCVASQVKERDRHRELHVSVLNEIWQVVVECTRIFEVLEVFVLSILFASLRLQSEVSGEGAAQVFEILSRKACGE